MDEDLPGAAKVVVWPVFPISSVTVTSLPVVPFTVHKIAFPGKVLRQFIPVIRCGMKTFMVRHEIALVVFPRDFIKVTLNSPFVTYLCTILFFLIDSLNTVFTRRSPKSIEYSIMSDKFLAVPFS